MTDDPNGNANSRTQAFHETLDAQKAELRRRKAPNNGANSGSSAGSSPSGGPAPSGGSGSSPQGNGNNGNTGNGGTPDTTQNPPVPQQNTPTNNEDTNAFDFESHAYNLGNLAVKQDEFSAKKDKGGSGTKPPERKKDGYKPGSSSNFLQACYNEIIVAAYAGAIDLSVDLTLDIFDWILYAPFSGGKSTEKKKDKNKNKTVFDYADEMIAENNEKAKELIKSFLLHHNEIIDNVERAQNGQKPEWRVWKGLKPECFDHLVEIKNKADADPNSPEATKWQEFKDLPQKAIEIIARQTDVANFAVHHAALSTDIRDVEPMHVEFTKAFNEMEKILENPKLSDADVKSGLSQNINNARQHIATCSDITEKLNQFAEQLADNDCTKEKLTEKLEALLSIQSTPEDVTKTFKKMKEVIENPNADIKDDKVKAELTGKILNIHQSVTINPAVKEEITEKLNNFSKLLSTPKCSRKDMAAKLIDLQEINPIKHKLKQDASILSREIVKNLELIDETYAANPTRADEEKNKYLEKINQSQANAAEKTHKDLKTIWLLRKFNTEKKARKATQYAANIISDPGVPGNAPNQESREPQKGIVDVAGMRAFINQMGRK